MRIEKDFLGEIEIPDEVYYGVQTTRALHNFSITGHVLTKTLLLHWLLLKRLQPGQTCGRGVCTLL